MKLIIALLFCALAFTEVSGQKIGKFGSSVEKRIGPKKVRVPYTSVISYLGYAEEGSEDEIRDGKKYTYIYVWIPAVAPELGLRMVSPADGKKIDDPIKASSFDMHASDKDYFDTYITLEKSSLLSLSDVSEQSVSDATWTLLEWNDDSSELPKQPSGKKYNSLLRYKSDTGNPLKALSVGLYRVGFTTFKRGEVKGTFLAQIGAPIQLPGVIVSREIKDFVQAQ